jgi:dTDP-4-amino-4,6-dideoxygalactose transaminase
MTDVAAMLTAARGLGRELWGAARGGTPRPGGFTGMTLGADDAALALEWLQRADEWSDPTCIRRYEEAFARKNGSQHAVSFASGRVALSAIVHALALQPGDEVVLPGYTCIVVANALRFAGVVPVFADIELETYGLDVTALEARITPRTRAVLLHHLYGLVCRDYDAVLEVARRRGLAVIEDCAHATGAEYRGRRVGTRGHLAFYSSEASKAFCTVQGGLAVSDDDALGGRLRRFQELAPLPEADRTRRMLETLLLRWAHVRRPSRPWHRRLAAYRYGREPLPSTSEAECRGERPAHYGERLPAPLAALGMNQLAKLDACNEERRATAALWAAWCRERGLPTPRVVEGSTPVFLRYPVLVEPERKRDLGWALRELGLRPGVWFESPLHPSSEPVNGCPQAARAVAGCINLPCLGVLRPE